MRLILAVLTVLGVSAGAACSGVDDATPGARAGLSQHVANLPEAEAVAARVRAAVPEGVAGVVLVARGPDVLVELAFGDAHPESGRANSIETAFDIGSIAKVFTAAAVLRLAADGTVALDDTLSAYLDGLPADVGAVTLGDLLRHESGLPNYFEGGDFTAKTAAEARTEIAAAEPGFAPGADCSYSNMGYGALALAAEAASGESFDAVVRETVLAPLGLEQTGFLGDPIWAASGAAHGVVGRRTHDSVASWPAPTWSLLGGGGMGSTASDLFTFWRGLKAGAMGEGTFELVTTASSANNCGRFLAWDQFAESRPTAGLFTWRDDDGEPWVFKGGANDFGFMAFIAWRPKSDVFVAALFNSGVEPGFSQHDAVSSAAIEHSTLYRRLLSIADAVE